MHTFTPYMFGLAGHVMRLRTFRGYDFGEVSSATQKAIRRGGRPEHPKKTIQAIENGARRQTRTLELWKKQAATSDVS